MAGSDGVTVTFELKLVPEALDMFLTSVPHMLGDTKNFPGCQSVRIVQHEEDPTRLLFVERWDSAHDYRKYLAWRNETGALDQLKSAAVSVQTNIWPKVVVEV